MEIISKFTVGSDQGVNDYFAVEEPSFIALHQEFATAEVLERYMEDHFDHRQKINDLNDLSTQLIIAYENEKPLGYSILKSGSVHPLHPEKRATQISFAVLPEYRSSEVAESLLKKTIQASSFTDMIWINILKHDPLVAFFEKSGFEILQDTTAEPFSLPCYLMSFVKIK
ncbi:GNAT family N-acetyltransferase [Chryseobacterium sp. MYb264]|uniref:GNAT family N-acetyltransferase n=1 Tax=Chryseobacterium sp. MYb264 TaxID=2745153 RepID=UPI002E143561|nr:GNAT family N-acetyltransferase [Chryseobacterium sp. MYb264]